MKALEQAGLIKRIQRKTSSGDWGAKHWELDGLIQTIRSFEPDFTAAKEKRDAARKPAASRRPPWPLFPH